MHEENAPHPPVNRHSSDALSTRFFEKSHQFHLTFDTLSYWSYFQGYRYKKRSLTRKNQAPEKKSGIELLSHSQICSTIVAGPLIDRVRDGNVSYKPAMDTGKKGLKMLGLCRIVGN